MKEEVEEEARVQFRGISGRCMQEAVLTVGGMTCGKCEKIIRDGIRERFEGEPGAVDVVRVSKVRGEVVLRVDINRVNVETEIVDIIQRLVNGKFKAKVRAINPLGANNKSG